MGGGAGGGGVMQRHGYNAQVDLLPFKETLGGSSRYGP